MRLFGKLIVLILTINLGVLGGIVGQRWWIKTALGGVIFTDDTCEQECWFGVALPHTTHWREVDAKLQAAGGENVRFRGSIMRFRLPSDKPGLPMGHVQVQLDEEGYATQICLFSTAFSIGDVIATFGEPEYFWLDSTSRRENFSSVTLTSQYYRIDFQMIYPDESIVAEGQLTVYSQPTEDALVLHPETLIAQLCRPGQTDFVSLKSLPKWNGIYQPAEAYTSFPPARRTDFDPDANARPSFP
jgi:hypothetical protein